MGSQGLTKPGEPESALPAPPERLACGEVSLRFVRVEPADPVRGLSPYYHFRILAGGAEVGHINFRVGHTPHLQFCAGHVGFQIAHAFRGHRYAWQACQALAPFVRAICPTVIITCDPDNLPSRKTIERLGAAFIDEIPVPPAALIEGQGPLRKRRYEWTPADPPA